MLTPNKFLAGLVGATLSLAAYSPLPASAEIDEMTLQYGSIFPSGVYLSELDRFFTEEVTKRSGGKIKFDVHWSSALGGPNEILPLVSSGAVGMAAIVTGYYFGEFPFAGLTNAVPATFESETVLDITADLFDSNETIQAEFDRLNLQPIFLRHLPQYTLICSTPVRTLGDMKGLKVRTYGAYIPKMFEAVGAIPVSLAVTEMYEALQRGTVDCAYWTRAQIVPFKLHEVGKYLIDLELGAINAYTMFTSKDTWDSWSEETRQLMIEVGEEATAMSLPITEEAEEAGLATMLESGVELVEFVDKDKLMETIPDMLDLWVEQVSAKFPRLADQAKATAADVRGKL